VDNLTHSLAGIVAAELVIAARNRKGRAIDPNWHRAAWLVSIGAHNAPDLDIVYTEITGGRLGYLLHHRGHTHTLALAPLLAALPLGMALAWARRRALGWSSGDRGWLAAIALLGPLLHIALDAANNYGVHPLWPISSEWMAGDTIFIVEPLLHASWIPLAITSTRDGARTAWKAVLAVALALPWLAATSGWPTPIPFPFAVATSGLALLVVGASARATPATRAVIAASASCAVIAVFAMSGAAAETALRTALDREARPLAGGASHETLDVARAPVPAAPACWQAIALQRETGGGSDHYAIHVAYVSAWPALIDASTCARGAPSRRTAALDGTGPRDLGPAIRNAATGRGSRPELRDLSRRCDVHAALRFVRMPFVTRRGDRLVLGDVRYDREPGLGFAELDLPRDRPSRCPSFVPPWIPWREDLIGSR
jgi:inner membrane protein